MIRWLALIVAAAIYGVAGESVFRRFTKPAKLALVIDRMIARALELSLFFDEPLVVWRAQKALLADNFKLLGQIAPALSLMAAMLLVAYRPLDRYLGHRPLAAGESAVVSTLPHEGFVVETPPVHLARTGEVNWRVRAARADADAFPYRGPRILWLPWFALLSTAAGLIFRYSRAHD